MHILSKRRTLLVAALVISVGAFAPLIDAQERTRGSGLSNRLDIVQLHHRSFTSSDGAPLRVSDMAQDKAGYLWMTSKNGLYRFDGVHFDQPLAKRLPNQMVKGILADADGSLWLGYYYGGVSHVVGDQVTTYRDGLPTGTVFAFSRTPDGVLWTASTGGLSRFEQGRWHRVGPEMGYDGAALSDLSQSRDGRLWVMTANRTYLLLRPGALRFEPVDRATALRELWHVPASMDQTLLDLVSTLFVDSAGALWLPSRDGIQRFRWSDGVDRPPAKETFGVGDGLSDVTPSAFFEDRESNIWVATALGIDQFRESRITPHEVDEHLFMPTMAFDNDGVAWVGTAWGGYRLTPASTHFPELGQYFSCVTRDRLGNVWMAGQSGLFHIVHGRIGTVDGPTKEPSAVTRYQSIAIDGSNNLWVAISGLGLYRRSGDRWVDVTSLAGLSTTHLTRLVADARGRLWVAFGDGHLARMEGNKTTVFGPSSGLSVGAVTDMSLDRDNVLVGGEGGLNQVIDDRFVPLVGEGGYAFGGISGIVQLASGEVWLQTDKGIVRISASEMHAAAAVPTREVAYELFDSEDGLIGQADKVRPLPSLAEGRDGRVWITTSREVASVDTRHLIRNRMQAAPSVASITADGKVYAATGDVTLPPLTRSIRLAFTGPYLTMPTRTNFGVRLAGFDEHWQDVGVRREASYTNLTPGDYRFDVRVTNEDGVTSVMPESFVFHVEPAFYQTWWLRLLVALSFAFVLGWIYLRRLASIHERAQIRMDERERIARELHDTLLQSVQSLLLTLDSALRQGSLGEHVRRDLERALAMARHVVIEGRSRVNHLRTDAPTEECPLETFLEADPRGEDAEPYTVRVEGRIRRLKHEAALEVVAILTEALRNALTHAEAAQVTIRVKYGRWRFIAEILDDGVGIPTGRAEFFQREGHWGLSGMRERAALLGGVLHVSSVPGQGTSVRLVLPVRQLYRGRHEA
jgi:signal transduction histidine kinase/ligand-binding sensor domain-containing protein